MPISWKLHNAANAVAPFFLHSIPKGERMLAQIVLKDREPLSDLVDLVRKTMLRVGSLCAKDMRSDIVPSLSGRRKIFLRCREHHAGAVTAEWFVQWFVWIDEAQVWLPMAIGTKRANAFYERCETRVDVDDRRLCDTHARSNFARCAKPLSLREA